MGATMIGITGSAGFLGWHLRCHLHSLERPMVLASRDTFATEAALDRFVEASSTIVHVAGVNRAGTDAEITDGNIGLASALVASMERTGKRPHVVFTNSTQSENDNVYGRAKQAAADVLRDHLSDEARFVDLVLPHLFGEFGRPFYNSAVTTFAHQLATGDTPEINRDGQLELLHAQDASSQILAAIDESATGRQRATGQSITVGEVWDLLEQQYRRYVDEGTIPSFADRFELQVFNTLRSQLDLAGHYPQSITAHADARGAFSELSRADGTGQTSISTSVPGITRGDHYHFDKIERFVVVGGTARIRLRRLFDDHVRVFDVAGDEPVFIDMPPLTTHNITNTGDGTMTTVFWAGDHFDPAVPDTFPEPVELAEKVDS